MLEHVQQSSSRPANSPAENPAETASDGETQDSQQVNPADGENPLDRPTSTPGNLIRGALIGMVETVPGVSGGTVALVVGIYHQLIASASHVVSAIRRVITGPNRRSEATWHMRQVQWKVIVPVILGMLVGLLIAVQFVGDWLEQYPELTRAAFFGMVLASLAVPLRMAGRITWGLGAAALGAAALSFWLVSLPPNNVEPHWWVVLPAAAVAVCALLLPGLSGSFLLLSFGLYEPTLNAVRELDFGYLGIFALGLVLGAVSIVKGLTWLLEKHRTVTLVVLSGVMLGALRALWPWQTDDRTLLAPAENLSTAVLIGVAGFLAVSVLVLLDMRVSRRARQRAAGA